MKTENNDKLLNYHNYLKLDKLLSAQQLQSDGHHDEMLFIIVHQAYEIWFKQIIHELLVLKKSLISNQIHLTINVIKRIRMILKTIVTHADILETMSPFAFYSFRNYLGTASGFQSLQFIEIEFLLGIKNEKKLENYINSDEYARLHDLFTETSVWDEFLSFIKRNNKNAEFKDISHLLSGLYINHSIYTEIAELMVDIDEGLQEWRYRHLKIVERMIGDGTQGTAKSKGFDYLKNTISLSFCSELWKVRNLFYA